MASAIKFTNNKILFDSYDNISYKSVENYLLICALRMRIIECLWWEADALFIDVFNNNVLITHRNCIDLVIEKLNSITHILL